MGRVGVTDAEEILEFGAIYKYGATGPTGNPLSYIPRITNEFLGTQHEILPRYRGTAGVRLGLRHGEVDAACWDWESHECHCP